jgi:hypothetical protein
MENLCPYSRKELSALSRGTAMVQRHFVFDFFPQIIKIDKKIQSQNTVSFLKNTGFTVFLLHRSFSNL